MKSRFNVFTNLFAMVMFMFVMLFSLTGNAFAADAKVLRMATGGTGGFYFNGLFSDFRSSIDRVSQKKWAVVQANEEGTDGTLANIKMVTAGDADIAVVQMCGLVLENPDVEVIGVIMYELTHLVSPKGSKVDEFSDLDNSKNSVALNMMGGAGLTFKVFQKEDKSYAKAQVMDMKEIPMVVNKMTSGSVDSLFFVSAPGTEDIGRLNNSGMIFRDFNDGDFDDFKYGGKKLYEFVSVGKKEGYGNNFTALRVPAVIIANKKLILDNSKLYTVLFDAVLMSKQNIKASRKFTYYPEN